MKIEGLENISNIFSIFHDGGIVSADTKDGNLVLAIDIQYLAERINLKFRSFRVSLYGLENIAFSTWPNDHKSEPANIFDIGSIFKPELEILEASIKHGSIEVVCNQASNDYDYSGGKLTLFAQAAEVQDEANIYYSLSELELLCKGYWNEWGARKD